MRPGNGRIRTEGDPSSPAYHGGLGLFMVESRMFQGAWLQRQGRGLPEASMQITLCPTTRGHLLMVASGKGNLQSLSFFFQL